MINKILASAADARFDAVYAIYRDSIAVREQKSKAELSAMVSTPGYRFLLSEQTNTVVAFSVSFMAAGENFCLLEYMAVDEKCRGRGVGSALFQETVRRVYSDHAAVPILVEIDSDRQSSREDELSRRRQNFYRRLGCRRIAGCAYRLPLPGDISPPEMDLFIYVPEPAPVMRRAGLERWLQTIYREVYGCSADDPRIATMLQSVADPIELV